MNKSLLKFRQNPIELTRNININTYFDKVGYKAGILGYENGSFEFWCYPYKICRNFSLSYLLDSSTIPIESSTIAKSINVSPEKTIIRYSYQSFTINQIFITPVNEPGSIILLDIDTIEPFKIICSFIPELQPMWPAGMGGQASFWSKEVSCFILTESRKKVNAFIGSPQAKGISKPPAHSFSDNPNQFLIEVTPENCKDTVFVIGMAGGENVRETIKKTYDDLISDPMKYYNESFDYFEKLRMETMNVITPDEKLNLAFEWGKVAYDNMIVDNPQLGKSTIAGLGCAGKSGRPGFGWFFGGDSFLNSFAICGYGAFNTVKDSLKFVQKYQRKDGKIAHEISQSAKLIDWFNGYPYAFIHADTTCFFLVSMYEYMISSGDTEFIKESWQSIIKAYNWCISTDENNDGLMDNTAAGLGAFEIPPFTKVKTDIYLSAAFTYSLLGMAEMAKAIAKPFEEYQQKYQIAREKINNIFWDKEKEYFAFAVGNDDKIISETTALCAVPMIWKLMDNDKAEKALEKINSAELQTDWGTRSMSSKSSYYDPLNYNYGAVWPFMTTFPSLANYRYGNPTQGYSILKNIIEHVFDNALGCCHEVFSGYINRHLEESVPHQAFSTTGYMLPVIKGLIGLTCNAVKNEIEFSPQLPPNWEFLEIHNYKAGANSFNFFIERGINLNDDSETEKNELIGVHFKIEGPETYKIKINLSFSKLSEIYHVRIGNQDAKYNLTSDQKHIILSIEIGNLKQGTILIEYKPYFEIIPYENRSEVGSINEGLKIIKEINYKNKKTLTVEGLNGYKYLLEMTRIDLISRLEGAELIEGGIIISFPEKNGREYTTKEIQLFMD